MLNFAKFKATAELQRASGGKKAATRLLDLPKLDDANYAGEGLIRVCACMHGAGQTCSCIPACQLLHHPPTPLLSPVIPIPSHVLQAPHVDPNAR